MVWLQISEPKVENSGIPQGVFIKRHRIPKPDEAYAVRLDFESVPHQQLLPSQQAAVTHSQ